MKNKRAIISVTIVTAFLLLINSCNKSDKKENDNINEIKVITDNDVIEMINDKIDGTYMLDKEEGENEYFGNNFIGEGGFIINNESGKLYIAHIQFDEKDNLVTTSEFYELKQKENQEYYFEVKETFKLVNTIHTQDHWILKLDKSGLIGHITSTIFTEETKNKQILESSFHMARISIVGNYILEKEDGQSRYFGDARIGKDGFIIIKRDEGLYITPAMLSKGELIPASPVYTVKYYKLNKKGNNEFYFEVKETQSDEYTDTFYIELSHVIKLNRGGISGFIKGQSFIKEIEGTKEIYDCSFYMKKAK